MKCVPVNIEEQIVSWSVSQLKHQVFAVNPVGFRKVRHSFLICLDTQVIMRISLKFTNIILLLRIVISFPISHEIKPKRLILNLLITTIYVKHQKKHRKSVNIINQITECSVDEKS